MKFAQLIIVTFFVSALVHGQGGYLGSRNGFELKFDMNPTLGLVSKERSDFIIKRARLFNPRVSFNYSRVITRHAEIAVGYEVIANRVMLNNYMYNAADGSFMELGTESSDSFHNGNWLIDNPRFVHHGLNFEYHYFRKGNLSPIGNYIGFAFKLGYCYMGDGQVVTYGDIGEEIDQSAFKTKYEILFRGKDTINDGVSILTSHFNIHLGQNIPVTKSLIFSIQLSLPIYYSASYNGRTRFSELYPNKFYDEYFTTKLDGFTAYSIGLFYRLSLDIGLKWMF